jgi:hypothetical protein
MYSIGVLEFKTKKEMEEYTRNLINKIGVSIIDKNNEHYKFFKSLIKNHENYDEIKGIGIKSINIEKNQFNNKLYHMTITRKDDTNNSISWLKCCRLRKIKDDEYLLRAMRDTINYQIREYKKGKTEYICNICNTDNINIKYHVDHNKPFQIIKDEFLNKCQNKPTKFKDDINGTKDFNDDDIEFKKQWLKYHKRNATYQILCKSCNLKKSNKLL